MIVTAVIAIISTLAGIRINQAQKQQQTVVWVHEHFGSIRYQYQYTSQYPSGGVTPYYQNKPFSGPTKGPGTPKWIRGFFGENFLETVEHVQIGPSFYEFSQLDYRTMNLINQEILPVLDLSPLAQIEGIRSITFTNKSLTVQSDLSPLAELKNLESITFEGYIPDISPLSSLENLHTIRLYGADKTTLQHIVQLKHLKTVILENTPVAEIQPLEELQGLERLHLRVISFEELTPLKRFTKLKQLSLIMYCKVRQDEVDDLKEALPNSKITAF